MGDCLCFASDFLSHTFEPHSYLVLPLGRICESGFNVFSSRELQGPNVFPPSH